MNREPEIAQDELELWEASLRQAAPTLPPALRQSTLARCAALRPQRQSRIRHLWWALGAVCVVQWLAIARLDAQRMALFNAPDNAPRAQYAMIERSNIPPAKLWRILQDRSELWHY